MSPRATILPKSTQLPHKTVVLSVIKGILMTTRAACLRPLLYTIRQKEQCKSTGAKAGYKMICKLTPGLLVNVEFSESDPLTSAIGSNPGVTKN